MKLKFVKYSTFANSPAYVMVLEAYVEALKAGLVPHELPLADNSNTLVVYENKTIVGAALYGFDEDTMNASINFICTNPDYRGKGISSKIIDRIAKEGKAEKCTSLLLHTHVVNTNMQKAAKKAKMNSEFIIMTRSLL